MRRFIFMSLGLLVLAFSLSGIGANQNCPSGWFPHNISCYKLFTERKNWDQAQRTCMEEQENGQLASITDADTAVKLSNKLSGNWNFFDIWFGLSLSKTRGFWLWPDGSMVTFTNWGKGEPNNFWDMESCAALTAASGYLSWNDKNCGLLHYFICQTQSRGG
uniref:C-type lectin lectoxin-Lio3 n=1 Tax=Erythrolamprus poecilogyrus TaxID=338838 RepID=LECM3_ERYPO|nr:RecName: Full=C-type lectin lectoxin-Lio3; Short=CTL; Flags: Precursor [Erythrolamprus poecilogyrus]ABU68502.1 Lectoxin-Lio3 [Erythrolamprus poecilogyrus]